MDVRIGEVKEERLARVCQRVVLQEAAPIGEQVFRQIVEANWLLHNLQKGGLQQIPIHYALSPL